MSWDRRSGQGDPNPSLVLNQPGSLEILIVIVNYKSAALTIDCLRSLEPEIAAFQGGRARVAVTDNASPDDSLERLEAAVVENGWSRWAEIQPLERNGGFSYGNNAAIRPALASAESPPDYVWLLNPDMIIHPPGPGGSLLIRSVPTPPSHDPRQGPRAIPVRTLNR